MSNQRARETRYQSPPFPSLPRPGQRDKNAKRYRSPPKSAKHTDGLRFLDEFAARDIFQAFFHLVLGIPPLTWAFKMDGEMSILHYYIF